MGTLNGLFDLTRSALSADQAALSATANNVANQNTVGYVRQVVAFQSGVSVTLSDGSRSNTSGPTIVTSSRRDRVLEQRVQQQTQAQSASSARADVYSAVESVFSISGSTATEGSTQVGTALNGLFSALTALAGDPSGAATRQGVLASAGSVASAFNAAANQLDGVQTTLNAQLKSSVAAVNALSQTVANLNARIGANSPNADAGPLEDQRQQAIAQLSGLVGLDQVSTENNGITLTTQGGTVLVAGDKPYTLTAINTGSAIEIRDSSGRDVGSTIQGGSVGGQLQAQNQDLPVINAALDAVAYRIATAVNTQNAAGIDANGNAGGPIFALTSTPAGAARSLTVAAASVSAIAAAAPGEGSLGNTNSNALAALANATDANGDTVNSQFAALLGNVGTQASTLNQQTSAQAATLTQLTTQRDSLSGVSLDEEATNLSQYQRSYEAAAKLFSILDSLLTASINLGSQQTYS